VQSPLLQQSKFYFEEEARSQGYVKIAGVDEAGRGPLAGPLLVAACILPKGLVIPGIEDSKKLSSSKREKLYEQITSHPDIVHSIIAIDPSVIDQMNILRATLQGMKEAVLALATAPDFVLVDGNISPGFPQPSQAIVQGDALSYSIGAASILAKVVRDRAMMELDLLWPEYGFAEHKGYPTKKHREALERLGPCPVHRMSYAPVQKALLNKTL
jgi:ribonuclease HII